MRWFAAVAACILGVAVASQGVSAEAASPTLSGDTSEAAPETYLIFRIDGDTKTLVKAGTAIAWLRRETKEKFAQALGRSTTIVESLPQNAVATYEVVVGVARQSSKYRITVTFTQTMNPNATPAQESFEAKRIDDARVERFLADTAKLFAKLVDISVVPLLVAGTHAGSAGPSAVTEVITEPPAAPNFGNVPPVEPIPVSPPNGAARAPGAQASDPSIVAAAMGATSPPAIPATAARAEASSPAHWWRIGGWASIALGAIASGVGVWQVTELQSAGSDFRTAQTQLDEITARDRGAAAASRANIAFGTAAACAIVGATILVLDYEFGVFGDQ